MFDTWKGFLGFLVGLAMTVGLLLTPHLMPGGWGYKVGLQWSVLQIMGAAILGLSVLSLTLWIAGRMIRNAQTWQEGRVIAAAVMIALIANVLYMFCIELFGMHSGWRALIAVLGVPVIYGNLGRVLGKQSLTKAMVSIMTGALTTMGAGFIIAVLIRGW